MYSREDVLFLLDEGDSVGAYEKRGVVRLSSHDAGMEALGSTLDRVQQGEVFHRECVCVCVCSYMDLSIFRFVFGTALETYQLKMQ